MILLARGETERVISDLTRLPSHVVRPATCLPTLQLGSLALTLRMPGVRLQRLLVQSWCAGVVVVVPSSWLTPLPAGRLQLIQSVLPQQVRPLRGASKTKTGCSTDWNTIVTTTTTGSSVTTQIYQPEKLKYFLFFIALLRLPCPVAVCPAHHLELVN